MADIVTLGVEVQTKGAAQASQQLGQFSNAAKGAATSADNLENQLIATATAQSKLATTARPLAGAMQGVGAGFQKSAGNIRNASSALGNAAQQMASGASAATVLGNALPAVGAGFGLLGAVVGIAVSALFSFAPALFEASEEAKELDAAIKNLAKSTDDLILKADALRFGIDEDQVVVFREINKLISERDALQSRLDAARLKTRVDMINAGDRAKIEDLGKQISDLEQEISKKEDAKRALEEQEALKKAKEQLAKLEAQNALMAVQVQFGKDSAEFAVARAAAELKVFEATLSTANEASGLNDELRAAFIIKQNFASLDIAGGLGAAADEASRMADELARASSNAARAAASAQQALIESQLRLDFAGDRIALAGALEGAKFDRDSGALRGSNPEDTRQTSFDRQRDAVVAMAEATERNNILTEAATEVLNRNGAATRGAAASTDKFTESLDPFEELVKDVAGTIESELNSAFASVLDGTKTLSEALLDFASNVLAQVAQDLFAQQFSKPIADGIAGLFASDGRVFNSAGVTAFAKGGVVGGPMIFPFANGVGLMGEAGPEAIMPLARGADGKLGVSAANGNSAPNVTINNFSGQDATASSDSAGNLVIDIGRAIAQDITSGGPSYRAIRTTFGLGNRLQQRG